jgi:hypothetical protein
MPKQTALMVTKTLTVSIECEQRAVYRFVSNPDNLPLWAKTFCRSIRKKKGAWVADTPGGKVTIEIAGRNHFGILDHYLVRSAGTEVFVPMRVISNGSGSEVIVTVFKRRGMKNEQFSKEIRRVRKDLKALKNIVGKRCDFQGRPRRPGRLADKAGSGWQAAAKIIETSRPRRQSKQL